VSTSSYIMAWMRATGGTEGQLWAAVLVSLASEVEP
jgi:hypothetical protein